jgi:hypothetical protein
VPRSLFLVDGWRKELTFVPAERATKTFVGTAQYVSPELLEANETSKRYAPGCSAAHNFSDFLGIARICGL